MATRIFKTVRQDGTGDYSTLNSALTGNAQNLVVNNSYLEIEIGGSWTSADTTQAVMTGYTTDATRYIRIYTTDKARHKGVYNNATGYALEKTSTMPFNFNWGSGNVCYVEGLQLKTTIAGADVSGSPVVNFFNTSATGILIAYFIGNICVLDISAKTTLTSCDILASYITAGGNTTMYAINNICYYIGAFTTGSGAGITQGGVGQICYAYNNTCIYGKPNFNQYTSSTFVAKNNIGQYPASGSVDYGTTFDAASATNISMDSTSPNSTFRLKTCAFVDKPNNNFHLSPSDTVAFQNGTDLSGDGTYAFNNDIDNVIRKSTWDIGADERFTPQVAPSVITVRSSVKAPAFTNLSTITLYNRFKANLLKGLVDLSGSGAHSIKCALLTSSYVLNKDDNYFTTVSTLAETSGTGYAAGGVTLSNFFIAIASGNFYAYFTCDPARWNNSSFSARYAIIYDNTLTTKDLIMCIDLSKTYTTTSSSLILRFPKGGLILIDN